MTAANRATPHEPATTCRYGTADDFQMDEIFDGIAAALGGMANVMVQLSLRPVAYGVMESKVESGRVDLHPWKRLRTTLTYISVALLGSEKDREIYREAVNQSHRPVHSEPDAPLKYNAFDPKLQLWVAACLYWGIVDLKEKMHGPLDEDTADVFYQYAARLGTTLQMRQEMWPADRAAFEDYWNTNLATKTIDARTRAYFDHIIDLKMLARPLRIFGRLHRFIVGGLLPQHLRDEMGMTWSARDQRRFVELLRTIGTVQDRFPKAARVFPMNVLLVDMRLRHRFGRPLV
ncbi:oxygenase MpaB family protein [Nocardia australiensis]|uniref:oxygenase MpaB family protein n=1 Tax=Nocardia australiensis TaxID=2887191 RepID=UPI001D14237F|nr:oxygenase MpaB family protein [Nocardia australiensis]